MGGEYISADGDAVRVLLDYYLEQPDQVFCPPDEAARAAWEQLVRSAGEHGPGWRLVDLAKFWRPKSNALARWSSDPEDCEACSHVNDMCPYHRGIEDGVAYLRRVIEAVVDEPDLANGVLSDYGRIQQQEADRKRREAAGDEAGER